MLIAEAADVRRAYPHASPAAIEHLLAALHAAWPDLLRPGHGEIGLGRLRCELAAYPGPFADFEALGVRAIFATAGRWHDLALLLGELRLAVPDGPRAWWVLVGDGLAARLWARSRGIGQASVVPVRGIHDIGRLRPLDPASTTIVHLDERPVPAGLALILDDLIGRGARTRTPRWRPGRAPADPDGERPAITV